MNLNIKGTVEKSSRNEIKKDVMEMTYKELKSYAKKEFNTLNKRISRLRSADKERGILSPALKSIEESGGTFKVGGKDLNGLRKEIARAISFKNMETSTITGARTYTNRMLSVFGDKMKNAKYVDRVYNILHKVQEQLPTSNTTIGSDRVLDLIQSKFDSDFSNAQQIIELDDEEMESWTNNFINTVTDLVDTDLENLKQSFLNALDIR